MKYICVGLDVRVWPWHGLFTADELGWPQNSAVFSAAKRKLNIQEGMDQLLKVKSEKELNKLTDFILGELDANLIALRVPSNIPYHKVVDPDSEFYEPTLDFQGWTNFGIDICDLNGFFSIYQINGIGRSFNGKLPDLNDNCGAMVKKYNDAFPEHAPFVQVQVLGLKK